MTASAVEHRNDTASENRTVTTSVSTKPSLSNPSRSAKAPCRGSSAPGRARELLLLLLEELGHGARALDGELLDLAVRGTSECVQELGDAIELARLEKRLEVVVREPHVVRHLGFVLGEQGDDAGEIARLPVESRERDQREGIGIV